MATLNEVERRVDGMEYRLTSLERFRKDYVPKVDGLVNSVAIENAVKSALKTHNRVQLSALQKAGAVVLFAVTLSDFVQRLMGG